MEHVNDFPVNEDAIKLREVLGLDLSIKQCQTLYSHYGGSVEFAMNKIFDDMCTQGCEDVVSLIEKLSIESYHLEDNKENTRDVSDTIKTDKEKDVFKHDPQISSYKDASGIEIDTKQSPEWFVKTSKVKKRGHYDATAAAGGRTSGKDNLLDNIASRTEIPHIVQIPQGYTLESTSRLLTLQTDPETKRLINDVFAQSYPKLLIIMRGVSGSGKSTLANTLLSVSKYGVLCSADNYFISRDGTYRFNPNGLTSAHQHCQKLCQTSLEKGRSPVIIDNTNITRREVDTYVIMGVKNNYVIELVEPTTSWKMDTNILFKKSTHHVPKQKISEMISRFEQLSVKLLVDDAVKSLPKNLTYEPIRPSYQVCDAHNPDRVFNDLQIENVPHNLKTGSSSGDYSETPTSTRPLSRIFDYVAFGTSSGTNSPKKGIVLNTSNDSNYYNDLCAGGSDTLFSSRMGAIFPSEYNKLKVSVDESANETYINDEMTLLNLGKWGSKGRQRDISVDNNMEGACSRVEPTATVTKIDEEANFLLNSFIDCRREELLHFFKLCNEDLNDTISLLLDSGYTMNVDPNRKRPSLFETPKQKSDSKITSDEDKILNVTSNAHELPTASSIENINAYKAMGARPKDIIKIRHSSEPTCENVKQDEDLFPNDGQDWIDFQIPGGFIQTLSDIYGGGTLQGKDPSSLSIEEQTIRIPPNVAFDLYWYLSLNVKKQEQKAEETSKYDQGEDSDEFESPVFRSLHNVIEADEEICYVEIVKSYKDLEASKVVIEDASGFSFNEIMAIDERNATIDREKDRVREDMKRNFALKLRFLDLHNKFPSMDKKVIDDVYVLCDFEYNKALNELKLRYPQKYVESPTKTLKGASETHKPFSNSSDGWTYDPDKVAFMTASEKFTANKIADDWLADLEYLFGAYDDYVSQVNQHRTPQAKGFYQHKAIELKDTIVETQLIYSIAHMIRHNAGNRDPNKLDLHGLRSDMAVKIAADYLKNRAAWVNNNKNGGVLKVLIITGRGNHSKNKIPKVQPKIRNLLESSHYSYRDKEGSFIVHLTAKDKQNKLRW